MSERPEDAELTNPHSERVRLVRSLSGRSARRRRGQFLVEGPQGVREAVRYLDGDVRDVYVTHAAAGRHPEIPREAAAAGIRVHMASSAVLDAMSGDAQGVLAVLAEHPADLADVLRTSPRLLAVLVAVRDPGNAGTVVRAADAAGADAVVLTRESVELHNPKVLRATAGSFAHLPVVREGEVADVVAALRRAGLTILAADAGGEHDLDDLLDRSDPAAPDLSRPTAWLFGNEAWGLPPQDAALADAVVRVPIHGRAESLNLGTASAVCLYASARARRRSS